jgi:hypothetical protein
MGGRLIRRRPLQLGCWRGFQSAMPRENSAEVLRVNLAQLIDKGG